MSNSLRDEHAPLQGLSARTRMALSLGILDDVTKRDIDTIRAIRIAFAHSPSRITFEHDTILKSLNAINALKYLTPGYVDDLKTLAQFNFEAARFAGSGFAAGAELSVYTYRLAASSAR